MRLPLRNGSLMPERICFMAPYFSIWKKKPILIFEKKPSGGSVAWQGGVLHLRQTLPPVETDWCWVLDAGRNGLPRNVRMAFREMLANLPDELKWLEEVPSPLSPYPLDELKKWNEARLAGWLVGAEIQSECVRLYGKPGKTLARLWCATTAVIRRPWDKQAWYPPLVQEEVARYPRFLQEWEQMLAGDKMPDLGDLLQGPLPFLSRQEHRQLMSAKLASAF